MSRGLAGQRRLDGTIRRNAIGQAELLISVSSVGVVNQTVPLIVSGNTISFAVQIDTV